MGVRSFFKTHTERLLTLPGTPTAVAGGVAIGIFLGFSPLYGLKTLLALVLAWLCRCNSIAAIMAVTLHDLFLPFMPFLLRLEYKIGFWLISHPHRFPRRLELHHMPLSELLKWTNVVDTTYPLMVGSVMLGLPSAVAAFFLTRFLVERRQKRRAAAEG